MTDKQKEFLKEYHKVDADNIKTSYFEDGFYSCIISDIGREDVVGVNMGYYENGKWYYQPIKDGLVQSIGIELDNVIGAIR